jgi:phage N-6-adenine-methyltransferase
VNGVLFSSATDDRSTPPGFFAALNKVFKFELDVCASNDNAKCPRFFSCEDDGLSKDWTGVYWMNPPYGRGIDAWVRKARDSARHHGATVVCLLPARTDTRWWNDYCAGAEIYFVPGRLKFGGAKHNAPFPSAVVVFRPQVAWAFEAAR